MRSVDCPEVQEVLVVDDGSAQEVPVPTGEFVDVRCIRQENRGPSSARNLGSEHVRGKYLLFLDDDDWMEPGSVRALVFCAESEGADVAYCRTQHYWPDGSKSSPDCPQIPIDSFHFILAGNPISVHAALIRREAFEASNRFDTTLKSCEDWDLWLKLVENSFKFAYCECEGAAYFHRHGSLTGNPRSMWRSTVSLMRKHGKRHANCRLCENASRTALSNMYLGFVFRRFQGKKLGVVGKAMKFHIQNPDAIGYWIRTWISQMRINLGSIRNKVSKVS